MTDHDELRRLAQAATRPMPGVCGVCSGHSPGWDGHRVGCRRAFQDAANPATVLALLDERDELRDALDIVKNLNNEVGAERNQAQADLAAANARLSNLGEAHKITKRLAEISDERLDTLYEAEAENATLRDDLATANARIEILQTSFDEANQDAADEADERDRLQARIDKALALVASWEAAGIDYLQGAIYDLRAALAADTPTTATTATAEWECSTCGHVKDHHFTPRLGGRCFRHECDCLQYTAEGSDHE